MSISPSVIGFLSQRVIFCFGSACPNHVRAQKKQRLDRTARRGYGRRPVVIGVKGLLEREQHKPECRANHLPTICSAQCQYADAIIKADRAIMAVEAIHTCNVSDI
jgi:hypothetical protein